MDTQVINKAREVYISFWDSFVKGDIETLASTIDDNFEYIGSTDTEVYHNKTEMLNFYESYKHEVADKAEIRNRQIDVVPLESLVLINEHSDLYALAEEEWVFYAKIRFSALLWKKEENWKLIQTHNSFPDMRAQEGEILAFDKLKEENAMLAAAVKQRTNELELKNVELVNVIKSLKSTQAQLIQTEKMASLGELTTGIAHEIQNPLNFVNNFSQLSHELIAELKQARSKDESEQDKNLEDEILNDIANNLEKINHHGKRASDIVTGMMEHSKRSSGEKTKTDINKLINEILRLAYYSNKAKERPVNCAIETDFDPDLPQINVVEQDLGRVILNLVNNGIWAVNERSKIGETAYKPIVSITTKKMANDQLLITVQDNGPGISDSIKNKIFQPFFTTKPTGQGIGLGLSLSYDIVKAHGGELKVETREGKGSQFHFILPYNIAENANSPLGTESLGVEGSNITDAIKGIKILLVEDNAFNIVVSTEELEEAIEDVHVDVAENGLIALEKIKLSTYDIILMDIQMPVMSGYEATKAIRNMDGEISKLPIIAMTAYMHKEEIDLCYEAGMNDLIGKPFNTEELLQKIHQLIKRQL